MYDMHHVVYVVYSSSRRKIETIGPLSLALLLSPLDAGPDLCRDDDEIGPVKALPLPTAHESTSTLA